MAFLVFLGFVVTLFVAAGSVLAIRVVAGRRMREQRPAPSDDSSQPAVRNDPPPLHLEAAEATEEPQYPEARALFSRARRARRSAAALYLLAGIAAACVLVWCEFFPYAEFEPDIVRLVLNQVWPVVLTAVTVAVPSFRTKLLVYGIAAALIFLGAWAIDEVSSVFGLAVIPTVILALVANRWLKTLALLAIPWVVMTLIVAMAILSGQEAWLEVIVAAAVLLVFTFLFIAIIVIGYRRKVLSDLSFQLGFVWAVFSCWYAANELVGNLWAPVAAVAAYALVALSASPMLRHQARRHPPVDLLILRAFGAPSRAHLLFEEIGTRWRYIGPVHLITGTDSVIANLDISELAHIMTGRSRKMYVNDKDDLLRRIGKLDMKPDPDGRYRVNDFFCFEDTWKPTVTSFSRARRWSYSIFPATVPKTPAWHTSSRSF